jgi:hypothetical protein
MYEMDLSNILEANPVEIDNDNKNDEEVVEQIK